MRANLNLLFFYCFLLFFYSCTEREMELEPKLRVNREAMKAVLLENLDSLFFSAFEQPEEADRNFARIYEEDLNNSAFLEQDPDLLVNKIYFLTAIKLARYILDIKKEINLLDYSQVHSYNEDYSVQSEVPDSDFSMLLQYVKFLKYGFIEALGQEIFRLKLQKNREKENVLNSLADSVVTLCLNRFKSYKEVYGKEDALENTRWRLVKYQYDFKPPAYGYFAPLRYNSCFPYEIEFGSDNRFQCDSILIPYIAQQKIYITKGADEYRFVQAKGEKMKLKDLEIPLGRLYRAGKDIKLEGSYYFGDKYLLLVFHCYDDYSIVLTIEYEINTEIAQGKEILLPKRILPFPEYPPSMKGWSSQYMSLINNQKHCGTYRIRGENEIYAESSPFSLEKQ